MKDKLEKTGHKKFYYQCKVFFTVMMLGLAVLALAAIPVGVSYRLADAAKAQAQNEETSQNVPASTTSSGS